MICPNVTKTPRIHHFSRQRHRKKSRRQTKLSYRRLFFPLLDCRPGRFTCYRNTLFAGAHNDFSKKTFVVVALEMWPLINVLQSAKSSVVPNSHKVLFIERTSSCQQKHQYTMARETLASSWLIRSRIQTTTWSDRFCDAFSLCLSFHVKRFSRKSTTKKCSNSEKNAQLASIWKDNIYALWYKENSWECTCITSYLLLCFRWEQLMTLYSK